MNQFTSQTVLVIGDVGIDEYIVGGVDRISPEAPVPIVRVGREWQKLGLAANVAENIVALGGHAPMISVIGEDDRGRELRRLAAERGISGCQWVTSTHRMTSLKQRIVAQNQQLLRVDRESDHPLQDREHEEVAAQVRHLAPAAQALIVEDYAKGLLGPKSIELWAQSASGPVCVDPNARTPLSAYRGATLLTPNTKEAEALTGVRLSKEDGSKDRYLRAATMMMDVTGAQQVLITRGPEGLSGFERVQPSAGGEIREFHLGTEAREVFDVSGAGDTMIATVALALASGANLEEAAMLGNLASGIVVGKFGTSSVTRQELIELLESSKI